MKHFMRQCFDIFMYRAAISAKFCCRTRKQCRHRYNFHLQSELSKTPFSEQEDSQLFFLHLSMGNRWARMSLFFHKRSGDLLKNRWNSLNGKPAFPYHIQLLTHTHSIESSQQFPAGCNEPKEQDFTCSPVCVAALSRTPSPQNTATSQTAVREKLLFNCDNRSDDFKYPFETGMDWSPVLLLIAPRTIPIHHFDLLGDRTILWSSRDKVTRLTVRTISFELLWLVLSEEFGWTCVWSEKTKNACSYDMYKSPCKKGEPPTFYGNSSDLRLFVFTYGLTGQFVVGMNTYFEFGMSAVGPDAGNFTTLMVSETPTMTCVVKHPQHHMFCEKRDCERGYLCYCIDMLCRTTSK